MRLIALSLFLVAALTARSQDARILTDKTTYGLTEVITAEYTIDLSDLDSVSRPIFPNCTVVSGPKKFGTSRWLNGVTSKQYKVSYQLKASATGSLTLPPLIFYKDGKAYTTGSSSLEITKEAVPQTDAGSEMHSLMDYSGSPAGTVQLIFSEEAGYYKIRGENGEAAIPVDADQVRMIRGILGLK